MRPFVRPAIPRPVGRTYDAPRHRPARSAINRRTASAFSASDNGSEAIIASPAENESALIGRESPRLETDPPTTSPRSFSGELVQPVVQRRERRFATRCGFVGSMDVAPDFGSEGWGFDSLRGLNSRKNRRENRRLLVKATHNQTHLAALSIRASHC